MDKLEYLEKQSLRNNIRNDGIQEEENESWDTAEEKVKQVLAEKLNFEEALDSTSNALIVSVGLLLALEDAPAQLSASFTTGSKRSL